MPSAERYAQEIQEFYGAIQDFQKKIPTEFAWKVQELLASHKALFDRFCPYAIGDRVELIETPVITDEIRYGWLGYKHFLVKGAKATVRSRDYRRDANKFAFELEFDDDSWIDMSGVKHPSSRKGLFLFSETMLVAVEKGDRSYGCFRRIEDAE